MLVTTTTHNPWLHRPINIYAKWACKRIYTSHAPQLTRFAIDTHVRRKRPWVLTSTFVSLSFSSITCLRIVKACLHASFKVIDWNKAQYLITKHDSHQLLFLRRHWWFISQVLSLPSYFIILPVCSNQELTTTTDKCDPEESERLSATITNLVIYFL